MVRVTAKTIVGLHPTFLYQEDARTGATSRQRGRHNPTKVTDRKENRYPHGRSPVQEAENSAPNKTYADVGAGADLAGDEGADECDRCGADGWAVDEWAAIPKLLVYIKLGSLGPNGKMAENILRR